MRRLHALILALVVVGSVMSPASAAAGGSIAGIVTGPDAAPVRGVYAAVYAWYEDEVAEYGEWELIDYVQTDAAGAYRLDSLPADTYRVGFFDGSGHGYLTEYWDDAETVDAASDIEVASGQAATGKDAQLAEGGHITGTVTGPHDQPVDSLIVHLYQWSADGYWSPLDEVMTDDGGHYDIGSLVTGTYRIGFEDVFERDLAQEYWDDAGTLQSATDIEVTAGLVASDKDARLGPGGHITGTITNADHQPIEDAKAVAYRWDDAEEYWEWVAFDSTGADGRYDVGTLPTGTYRVRVSDSSGRGYLTEYWDDASTIEDGTDIDVTAGDTTVGKDAELADSAHITGTVTRTGDIGLPDVIVTAYRWDSDGDYWDWAGSGWSDEDGRYDVSGLATDTYRLEFVDLGERYQTEYWDDAAAINGATGIAVTTGETVGGKDARLALDPSSTGRISGTVTGPSGQPLGAINVRAYRQDLDTGRWNWVDSALTDISGGYQIDADRGGSYKLQFEDSTGTYATEYWDNAPTPEAATPIALAAGAAVTGKDARLAVGGAPPVVDAPAVVNLVAPTIVGATRVGSTLTATTGTWDPAAVATRFQWVVGGAAVPGATNTTYTLGAADQGKTLELRVTASATGRSDTTLTTRPVTVAPGSLVARQRPSVLGRAKQGGTLTVKTGVWAPVDGLAFAVQWYAGRDRIADGHGRKLRLTGRTLKAVAGRTIRVKVTATAPGYASRSAGLVVHGKVKLKR